MDNAPYDFMINHQETDLIPLMHFKHRTFNATDLLYFILFLSDYYKSHDSLEDAFFHKLSKRTFSVEKGLINFYEFFFSRDDVPQRTKKHIASPQKKSTCKRLNMYLRWMVRKDKNGVDFGLWNKIQSSQLIIPMDVHVARVARYLNLLKRKQTDWGATMELTERLRNFDPQDPAKYDFALFGLGVIEKMGISYEK